MAITMQLNKVIFQLDPDFRAGFLFSLNLYKAYKTPKNNAIIANHASPVKKSKMHSRKTTTRVSFI